MRSIARLDSTAFDAGTPVFLLRTLNRSWLGRMQCSLLYRL